MMKMFLQCLFSPRLFKIYRYGSEESLYQPYVLEKYGDRIITAISMLVNTGMYSSPFICMYLYKRGFFSMDEMYCLARFCTWIGCVLTISYMMRGVGRVTNPHYRYFMQALNNNKANQTQYLMGIRKYDFEYNHWPVTYSMPPKNVDSWAMSNPFVKCANDDLPRYQSVIIQVLAFLATHTFGLRLIYPGSLSIVHHLLWTTLFQGRTQLVETYDGLRNKIRTADGNDLDTMFVDNRESSANGKTLVICCEGNTGFYEIGIMVTPIKNGFSAIGWNHPGFAGSTGLPYPEQEHNAIDAVLQYAINELKFSPWDIVMFGWSIGGYTAAWAAVNYPVKGLVLDATFDDLLPLAQSQMPGSWSLLVKEVVRSHVDLNVAALMRACTRPVVLVRRTADEIICLSPGKLSSNRGNFLLIELIKNRHPELFEKDEKASTTLLENYVGLLDTQRLALLEKDIPEEDKRIIRLISKYSRDYKSTHCTPLPDERFAEIMQSINQ